MLLSLVVCILMSCQLCSYHFFFFNDTATTEIYTLSLHDALPISRREWRWKGPEYSCPGPFLCVRTLSITAYRSVRSEEHTSELQSRPHLVCRLLLEKKKINNTRIGGNDG